MIKTIVCSAFCALALGAVAHAQSTHKRHTLGETDNSNADLLMSQRAQLSQPAGVPSEQTSGIMPADRLFAWNPGMLSKGGVPNRTTICAELSPSGGNDSAAIQAKLDSCPSNQVVMLNPGTFIVNNYLLIHSAITLRGSGAGVTILKKTNGARERTSQVVAGTNGILTPVYPGSYTHDAQPILIVGPSRWPGPDKSTSQNLTADGQPGAFSVTVAYGSVFSAGQFVLLDELSGASWQPTPAGFPSAAQVWRGDHVAWNRHNPLQPGDDPPAAMSWFSRPDRPTCEIKEIASVSGNTVTFTSPLSIGYRTSHTAQLTSYTARGSRSAGNSIHVTNAGVEYLTTIGGADGEVRFENAAYSWAKNVEVTQWIGEGVAIDGSFRVEVRDSYIHTGSWPQPGGGGYAISLAAGSSEALIENDISIDVNKVMVFRSSGAGSVVAYNYSDDGWIYGTEAWVEAGINASHMAGPHHVLFEGNYSFNADSDYTHGNAVYLTFFRNWLSGQRRDFTDGGNIRAVGLAYGSWWDSFIGNVLGRPGQMTGWAYTDPAMSCDANGSNCTGNNANWSGSDIWRLGYDPERWSMNPDPQTISTVIRDGNYDFLTNSQRWHNTPGGFALPNSMYLTSQPAFFKTNHWPWVDPSTGTIFTLPAKARYDAGTPNSP
jgi:Pectate lyase superfamily protein